MAKQLTLILLLEITLLCLLKCSVLNAQNFERFSNKEGFNQNSIKDIAQDKYGFLWFGTPNGLIKFDGYDFYSYTSESSDESSISYNYIERLFTDSDGILWVGTSEGVDVFIPWLEKFYKVPLPYNLNVSHIAADVLGQIWISGQKELYICKLVDVENGIFEVSENLLKKKSEIPPISDFYFVDETTCLLATSQGLFHLEIADVSQQKWPTISSITSIPAFSENSITRLKKIQNMYWIGTEKGLFKATLEGDRMHIIRKFEKAEIHVDFESELFVKAIFEDAAGSVWIGTTTEGLAKYIPETDSFTNYPYDPKNEWGLSSKYINVVFQDEFNVLWIGTAHGGVNKLDLTQKQFSTYSYNPYDKFSISDNLINAILEDRNGRLWIAGYDKTLSRSIEKVNNSTVQQLRFENLEAKIDLKEKDIIRSILEDDRGFIWIGTDFSLIVYDPFSKAFKNIKLKVEDKIIDGFSNWSLLQIDANHLVLGGHQIAILNNPWDAITNNREPEIAVNSYLDLGDNRAHTMVQGRGERMWCGTQNGLFELTVDPERSSINLQKTTIEGETARLSNNNIFSLFEDHKGNLWVGTFGGGLNKITIDLNGQPQKIEYFRKNNALPDDAVYGILPEGDSLLWLSTDMGLVRFYTENDNIDVFDVRDGLAQNNFRQGAFYKGTSGYYYFGGLNGLTIFQPEAIKLNTQPPEILITDLLLNNQTVRIGEKLDDDLVLKKSISETEKIKVSQKQRSIGFNIAVDHSSMPFKNKVAYKLEGFNDEWVEENIGKTTITYTNLSAGHYTFTVKGANGDGVWSNKVKSLQLEILPYWYRTWWSYLLFATLILLFFAGITVYFILHEKLKQKLIYEQKDKERIDTINQRKFRYFTNISHEFRTPLTLISGPLEHIINTNKDQEQSKYLAIIQKNTKRLLGLADHLITFRQADQGYVRLNLSRVTLGNFIYPATEAFENYAIEKNINFFYKVSSPNKEIVIDIEKIERILFNLLSNSFKNTTPHCNISVEADIINNEQGELIKIDVLDTGKGIPEKDLNNIFERFYQLGTVHDNISGGGIGLAFCKSLVELFKGTITVKSEPNVETRFTITIPSTPDNDFDTSIVDTTHKSYIKDWVPLPSEFKAENKEHERGDVLSKHTILIVEDEEDFRIFLKSYLSNDYNMLLAQNGIEGLRMIKAQEPDLVISDIMMPEMDGFSFCEKIKSNPETCHIPVLLLTALGDNENLIKGLEFGADEYMSKPFSLKHLALRVKKLIENNIKLKEHFAKSSTIPNEDIGMSQKDIYFLNEITKVVSDNMADSTFGVEELSTALGLSTSHFYRRLKQLTGQVPNVYLRNFRLQHAADLLKSDNGFNVTEVMYQIGIESPSYFSTSFKKLHGVSPSEFLRKTACH